jgi:hypothetical protein
VCNPSAGAAGGLGDGLSWVDYRDISGLGRATNLFWPAAAQQGGFLVIPSFRGAESNARWLLLASEGLAGYALMKKNLTLRGFLLDFCYTYVYSR